jgi:pyruvate/2-oxoglutarate dehydrogenase complex dihydrolipoamide dehydrogenase (E3) component
VVVGAGPLGLELAQALARLGVEVTMFDQGEHIAALRDAMVAKNLKSILGKEFPIHFGREARHMASCQANARRSTESKSLPSRSKIAWDADQS